MVTIQTSGFLERREREEREREREGGGGVQVTGLVGKQVGR
jgi:hypothetical protein